MQKINWNEFKKEFEEFKIKFKRFDPKLQKNIMIGSFMIFSVVATGLFLALTALARFGGKILDAKITLQ